MIWEDFIEIGYIARAHGIKGEVKAILDVHDIEDYIDRKDIWLGRAPSDPIIYQIKRMVPDGKFVRIAFEDIEDRSAAETLAGNTLLIPQSELPELEEGQYYYYEILGYSVHDSHYGELGKVDDIMDAGHQDLIMMRYKGKEVLIPIVDEVLLKVDKKQKQVHTSLPKGLLETYLGEQ